MINYETEKRKGKTTIRALTMIQSDDEKCLLPRCLGFIRYAENPVFLEQKVKNYDITEWHAGKKKNDSLGFHNDDTLDSLIEEVEEQAKERGIAIIQASNPKPQNTKAWNRNGYAIILYNLKERSVKLLNNNSEIEEIIRGRLIIKQDKNKIKFLKKI